MAQPAHNDDATTKPLIDFWTTLLDSADEDTRKLLEQLHATADPQAWRKRWLKAVSDSLDAYMRSPPFLQAMVKAIENIAEPRGIRQWDRFLKLPPTPGSGSSSIASTPKRVVYREDMLRLLHYKTTQPQRLATPILICFALVNRPYILDLKPDRSVIRQLLRRGFDVYLVDWGTPTQEHAKLRLDDYVCGYLPNVANFVRQHARCERVNLLGYCMGGTMSVMFTSLYRELVNNLIVMAAPIDFSGEDTLLNVWSQEKYFDVDALIDTYGNCPGEFLQMTFQMMRPIQNFHEKYVGFIEKMHDDSFLENFFAMEQWTSDNIPVAGETFRGYVKMLYQQNLLVQGRMKLNDRPVDLGRITCPLLMLTADFDHLVAPHSTLALADHVNSPAIEHRNIRAGHVGLAVSSKAHQELWPAAADWIAQHS